MSTAHHQFLRVWIKTCWRSQKHFICCKYVYTNPRYVKCKTSLSLSLGWYFLDFWLSFPSLALTETDPTPWCQRAWPCQGKHQNRGTIRPRWASPDALPGHQWRAGHSVKTARENCTLEEKANAAAKLKISMVDFQLSQVG